MTVIRLYSWIHELHTLINIFIIHSWKATFPTQFIFQSQAVQYVCVCSVGKVTACGPADGCCDPVILYCQSCLYTDGWTGWECIGEWMSACWLFFSLLSLHFLVSSYVYNTYLLVVSELWIYFCIIELKTELYTTLFLPFFTERPQV